MRFLRTAALLALAALTPLAASGQMMKSTVDADSRSLLFLLGTNLTPTGFDGSALSYKWHSSPTRAKRVGASLDARYQTFDDRTRQNARLEIDFLFLTYRRGRTPVYFYYGFGPIVRADFTRSDDPGSASRRLFGGAGAAGVVGVEWPLNRVISLMGEYGVAVLGGIDEAEGGGQAKENGYSAEFESRGGRVGVSVYF